MEPAAGRCSMHHMQSHMRRLYRRAIIGAVLAAATLARWRRLASAGEFRAHDVHMNANISPVHPRKVWNFQPVLQLQTNSTSARLVAVSIGSKHDADVIWSTQTSVIVDLVPIAIGSMHLRLQRNGRITRSNETQPDAEEMKQALLNFTQDELNAVDPDWQIYVLEYSDGGMGSWPYWFLEHEVAPLVGWNRLNYATRSTQNDRVMDQWVHRVAKEGDPSLNFGGYIGKPLNFTPGGGILERGLRSVQRLSLSVREDIVEAIDGYMKDRHRSAYDEAWGAAKGCAEEAGLRLSKSIARLPRPTDVRTFWNASVCNMMCSFRNRVAEIVASLPEQHPSITANTDVVGFIHKQGRNQVHPDYIDGLMTTKIVVLAQRDRWEGHVRLYEALLSGALVMSDPQVYWPHGTVDGENIVVYHGWADLEEKILHYLDPQNEEERVRIGRRGREVALTHHRTWTQAERLFLNDMSYRNDCGLSNKPW